MENSSQTQLFLLLGSIFIGIFSLTELIEVAFHLLVFETSER
jgi:hypothetical protein